MAADRPARRDPPADRRAPGGTTDLPIEAGRYTGLSSGHPGRVRTRRDLWRERRRSAIHSLRARRPGPDAAPTRDRGLAARHRPHQRLAHGLGSELPENLLFLYL